MWHEARRVEKQLRGMMVNFKKRAERRRAFYSRMKQDPVQLLRIYGQKCKIHIDAQVAAAAEHRSVMMPWQGQADNMIDRFDGRANLDYIPPVPSETTAGPLMETDPEQNRLNYERYKALVMIDYSGASEEDYLQQLAAEEMLPKKDQLPFEKKEKSLPKATIGYSYSDTAPPSSTAAEDESDDSNDSDAESILSDIDVTVDIDELSKQEMQEIDTVAMNYGMAPAQFCRKLKVDKVEAEEQKKIKDEEEERAMMGGRKSRKERRSARDRQRHNRVNNSPPSYARRSSPTYEPYRSESSSSSSRSCSPENAGQVEFITEFGAVDEKPGTSADSNTHSSLSRTKDQEREDEKRHSKKSRKKPRSRSRERRRSRDRSRSRSRERRRSRSSSRDLYRPRDRSRSSSRDRYRSRDRSRSSSRDRYRSRDRSRSSSRDRHRRRSRSRSSSRDRDRFRDDRDRYRDDRDRYRDSKESLRAKDTAKATAKLTGSNKDKKSSSDIKDKSKLTPQERMKRRMQLMLNKQLKVDRKEERIKRDAKEKERMNREDDLREMQRKWRDSRRSPSPRSWSRRSRSRSPDRSRYHNDTESPTRPVPIVDFDQETKDEEVIHYVYNN